MRAKEFVIEGKSKGRAEPVTSMKSDPLPGVFVQKNLRNTDPYMQYRYAMAVASARSHKENGVDYDQESSWAENLIQVMYTPEDEETIRLASKMMGVTPTRITNNRSTEPKYTFKDSTVARFKKNRYGV
jgi:hypothetical protein